MIIPHHYFSSAISLDQKHLCMVSDISVIDSPKFQPILMKKKTVRKRSSKADDDGLWIAPRFALKGTDRERAWDERRGNSPSSSRLLEYADIALGLKKVEPRKKRMSPRGTHDNSKTDPYQTQ
jgi:hypothetical protein